MKAATYPPSAARTQKAVAGTTAVLYVRVSSREQEEEGWSIDAQLRLLKDYAAKNGIAVIGEFVEAQTAKVAGRKAFGAMIEFLSRHPNCAILAEKTDRLYRNIRDWVTIEDLAATLHFVREGQIIGPDSRSSDKLVHGFRVLMARNYVENLSEEIRKGMSEKALQGVYPSHAPLGYLNAPGPSLRRKIIVPDPVRAQLVRQIFGECEKGIKSVIELTSYAAEIGLRTKKGRRVVKAGIHRLLINPVYCGQIRWHGEVIPGVHEPLISEHQFNRCQEILRGRHRHRSGYGDLPFAYRGLVRCACGQLMTAETKKSKYVYYHCVGPKSVCGRPYVKEERLTEAFQDLLCRLTPPPQVQAWLRKAVLLSHDCQMADQKSHEERLEADVASVKSKLERLYLDKVAGELSGEIYTELRRKFEGELRDHQSLLAAYQHAGDRTADDSLETLELAFGALARFNEADSNQRNETLKLLLSNCNWERGQLRCDLRRPFDLMLEANQNRPEVDTHDEPKSALGENWWR
jgi:site-specific DNA recombinase